MTVLDDELAFLRATLGLTVAGTLTDLRAAYYKLAAAGSIPMIPTDELADGDVPVWDETEGKWVPGTGGGGGGGSSITGAAGTVDTAGDISYVTGVFVDSGTFSSPTESFARVLVDRENGIQFIIATAGLAAFQLITISATNGFQLPTDAPSLPGDGAVWVDGTSLFYRSGGVTYQVAGTPV